MYVYLYVCLVLFIHIQGFLFENGVGRAGIGEGMGGGDSYILVGKGCEF